MKLLKQKGVVNNTELLFIQDSSSTTGAGLAGLLATNLTAYYTRVEDDNDVNAVVITLSDLTGTGTVHTDGGLEEIDATNMPGWYRLDLPDAIFATGASHAGVSIIDSGANNVAQLSLEYQLTDYPITGTITLPGQEAPPLAPTMGQLLGWLYKVLRNRTTQTSTAWNLLADDETTVDAKAVVSDNGTTAVIEEIVSGP